MIDTKITAHLNTRAVQHRMVDLGISDNRALADKSGADYTGLCKAMSHKREPSKTLILRLSVALDMPFEALLNVEVEQAVPA